MSTDSTIIHVRPDSELGKLLDQVDPSVRLEKDGVVYRLVREDDDIWAGYDPGAVADALRAAAGILSPEEGEELKAHIYRARQEGSRPPDRP